MTSLGNSVSVKLETRTAQRVILKVVDLSCPQQPEESLRVSGKATFSDPSVRKAYLQDDTKLVVVYIRSRTRLRDSGFRTNCFRRLQRFSGMTAWKCGQCDINAINTLSAGKPQELNSPTKPET